MPTTNDDKNHTTISYLHHRYNSHRYHNKGIVHLLTSPSFSMAGRVPPTRRSLTTHVGERRAFRRLAGICT